MAIISKWTVWQWYGVTQNQVLNYHSSSHGADIRSTGRWHRLFGIIPPHPHLCRCYRSLFLFPVMGSYSLRALHKCKPSLIDWVVRAESSILMGEMSKWTTHIQKSKKKAELVSTHHFLTVICIRWLNNHTSPKIKCEGVKFWSCSFPCNLLYCKSCFHF